MPLNEVPEEVHLPEAHYVHVQKTGPFQEVVYACWVEFMGKVSQLPSDVKVDSNFALYKPAESIYCAGAGVSAEPLSLPEGLAHLLFEGGKYCCFSHLGAYSDLSQSRDRVLELIKEQDIATREGFFVQRYANSPDSTPEEALVTHIMVPVN